MGCEERSFVRAGLLTAVLMVALVLMVLPGAADYVDISTNADTFIYEASYSADTNYGNSSFMSMGTTYMSDPCRSLVNFDTSSVAELDGATITSMDLIITPSKWMPENGNGEIGVYEVDGTWVEDDVTWNTKPPLGNQVGTDTLLVTGSQPSEVSWTLPGSAWAESSDFDFYLALTEEFSVEGLVQGETLEDSDGTPAYLRVEYDQQAIPEPGTMALMGIGLAGLAFIRRRRDK